MSSNPWSQFTHLCVDAQPVRPEQATLGIDIDVFIHSLAIAAPPYKGYMAAPLVFHEVPEGCNFYEDFSQPTIRLSREGAELLVHVLQRALNGESGYSSIKIPKGELSHVE